MTRSACAAALFASSLQPSDRPSRADVGLAIQGSMLVHGGTGGCLAVLAAEYGEHPDQAAARMTWALRTVDCVPAAELAAA